jgi:hypothetical protein
VRGDKLRSKNRLLQVDWDDARCQSVGKGENSNGEISQELRRGRERDEQEQAREIECEHTDERESNWIDSSRHTGLVLIQNSYIDQIHTIKEK